MTDPSPAEPRSQRIAPPPQGQAPDGFEEMRDVGGFSDVVGPLYLQRTEWGPRICFHVLEQHCNPNGVAHGGWLMAVMDHVIAGAGVAHIDALAGGVTASASFDFMAPAVAGDWCETEITLCEPKRRMAFVEARIHGPRGTVLRCNGIVTYRKQATES